MTAIAITELGPVVERERGGRRGRKGRSEKRHAGKLLAGAALMRAMSGGHRGHGHGRGHGFGPQFDPRTLFGGMRGFGFGPPGRGGRGGRRARRGDVRAAALLLLDEQPRNGYQLMQEIEDRSGGMWRPSPGSVYPALAQLEDEGLVRSDEGAGRRAFELTDEGRAYVEEHRDALGVPWEEAGGEVPEGVLELRSLMMQLGMAAMQVAQAGDEAQTAEARKVLEEARRALYRILAGDEPAEG
jgi:DNA-binding PadR family transcriptional regulator